MLPNYKQTITLIVTVIYNFELNLLKRRGNLSYILNAHHHNWLLIRNCISENKINIQTRGYYEARRVNSYFILLPI